MTVGRYYGPRRLKVSERATYSRMNSRELKTLTARMARDQTVPHYILSQVLEIKRNVERYERQVPANGGKALSEQ